MAIWIQLPKLPIEYFDIYALYKFGSLLGKPIKVGWYTVQAKN